ncbi:hypothetical protein C7E18_17130 [Stenotrophomonas maltophilia]|nr:hypothetical protein C7E18_17130 [Stenotrophomonas maltophilia]
MAWIYCRSRETVEGGVGPVAGRERHGWRDRAYMDVLARRPRSRTTPPTCQEPSFCCCSGF